MSEPYLSQITPFANNFEIKNWMYCNGRLLGIHQKQALFSLMGAVFGGNGRTTFGLPGLHGRSLVGAWYKSPGPGPQHAINIGDKGGQNEVTLKASQLPGHKHHIATDMAMGVATGELQVSTGAANAYDPNGAFLAKTGGPVKPYATTVSDPPGIMDVTIPAQSVQMQGSTQMTGEGQPVEVISPYMTVNYLICVHGNFPRWG